MNKNGHQATLKRSHPGNENAVKSGVFSRTGRILAPRAGELAAELLGDPDAALLDLTVAEEIASLLALIEAIDLDLAERGVSGAEGPRQALVDMRLRATTKLYKWLATVDWPSAAEPLGETSGALPARPFRYTDKFVEVYYGVLADPSASASERMRAADRLASIDKSFTEGEAHASAYLQRVYERTIAARHDEQHLEAADEAGAE